MSPCPLCSSSRVYIAGYRGLGLVYRCSACSKTFIEHILEDDTNHSLDGIDPDMYNQKKAAEAAKI
jgi:transposase-like protein